MSKQCTGPCQKWLPFEYFDKDPSKTDGYRSWCKKCRKEKALAKQDALSAQEILKVVQDLEAPMLATLRETRMGGGNLPHHTVLLEKIIELMGGMSGFASFYVAQIIAAKPGSVVRERMLGRILAAIQLISEDARVTKPRHLMSDAELADSLKSYGLKIEGLPESNGTAQVSE